MLKKLSVKDFAGVPYLETSQLMLTHKGKLTFSTTKPNVIVGPNGAGKSALLTALALRFLAYFTGESTFDGKFVNGYNSKDWWGRATTWGNDYTYLKGLEVQTDNAPVLYYRPGHVPGNEDSIASSMMMGFFEQAKQYAKAVDKKSSGQGNQALLDKVLKVLAGGPPPTTYLRNEWRYGDKPIDLSARNQTRGFLGSYDYQAEILKSEFVIAPNAVPLLMMDEPEQSLDARAEAKLWEAISAADCSRVQVIVATHSVYPLLHPKKFNLIEAEAGFIKDVSALYAR